MTSQARWFLNPLFGEQYHNKVIGLQKADLIGFWPLNEGRGITTPAAKFDGSTSILDIYSASLASAFSGAAGTVSLWFRMSAAGVWTDSTYRYLLKLEVSGAGTDFVRIYKSNANNTISFRYGAGGTTESVDRTSYSPTTWQHIALTWDKAADQVKAYVSGAQQGSTQTGLGTWSGSISNTLCTVGASSTVPSAVHSGWIAHPAVWTKALTAAEILAISNAQSSQESQILATQAANLIGYWPMDEITGTNADNAEGTAARDGTYTAVALADDTFTASYNADNLEGTAARDGTYTGVTLNYTSFTNGQPAPLFDGVNDYLNIYTASLAAAFNGQEGTISAWGKVSASGVWSDATTRRVITLFADANDYILIAKPTAVNSIQWDYKAGGTAVGGSSTVLAGTLSWFHLAMTWSKTADTVSYYINGAEAATADNSLGSFSGSLSSSSTNIGAGTITPSLVWAGYLSNVAIWKAALAASKIKALSVI